jgi:uncharacterized protein YegP (UPF0339 family)
MSRLIRSTVVMMLFGLATASFAFGQRQTSGSSTSQDRKSGQSSTGSSASSSGSDRSTSSSERSGTGDRASTAGDRSRSGSDGQASKRATFEVYKDKAGEYRWRLRANNSQILAMAAQGYSDKRAAMNAIESVKRDVASAPIEEKEQTASSTDKDGQSDTAATAGDRAGSGSSSSSTGRNGSGSRTGAGTGSGTGAGSGATSGNRNR